MLCARLVFVVALLSLVPLVPLAACAGRSASVADAGPPDPSIAFVGLPSTIDCDADDDPGADGLQLDITVALSDDDGSGFAEIELGNNTSGDYAVAALADGRALLRVQMLAGSAPALDNTLEASTANDDGRVLAVSAVVSVDCLVPPPSIACAFTAPLDGAVIAADSVDVSVACVLSGLSVEQRELMAGARLRVDAVASSDGSTHARELDLVEGSASGNLPLPGTGAHTLTATVLDPHQLFEPDPTVSIAIDVQP
ncbi:MAG: hypothetical protein IT383_04590 [Deltaproteobacteria bacterium]|nr:hypothetical protein [Deltaproteobacteria bacterium]